VWEGSAGWTALIGFQSTARVTPIVEKSGLRFRGLSRRPEQIEGGGRIAASSTLLSMERADISAPLSRIEKQERGEVDQLVGAAASPVKVPWAAWSLRKSRTALSECGKERSQFRR